MWFLDIEDIPDTLFRRSEENFIKKNITLHSKEVSKMFYSRHLIKIQNVHVRVNSVT